MGNAQSGSASSTEGTLDWENTMTNATEANVVPKTTNGMEVIDLHLNDIENIDSVSETSITQVFQKLDNIVTNSEDQDKNQDKNQNNDQDQDQDKEGGSSPFISTELYNKIMEGGDDSTSSPFISTEVFKKIIHGGAMDLDDSSSYSDSNSSESSTSSSEMMKALSQITISSSDYPTTKTQKPNKSKYEKPNKSISYGNTSSIAQSGYNFSDATSDINHNSDTSVSSNTQYNVQSSSINTSDINLVSVDSVNGRRYL